MPSTCSCGHETTHKIGNARTSDGVAVLLWSDGTMTGWAHLLPGLPSRKRRDVETALTAGRLLLGEVSLWDAAELPVLYEACEWAAARDGLPGTVRIRAARRPPLRSLWTVLATDRDGVPVERFWRLSRLRWPGLAVFDTCSARLRYSVHGLIHGSGGTRDTYMPTGIAFATLAELRDHLESY